MATKDSENIVSYAIINNIPSEYHSSDLRNYFSQFLESGGFDCFHFRHRPEHKLLKSTGNVTPLPAGTSKQTDRKRSTCCVVKVKKDKMSEFLKMYNRKHWNDRNGEVMSKICCIAKVKLPDENIEEEPKLASRKDLGTIPANREDFSISDLQSLPELHPPDLMPNGNVGTPTMLFMDYIKQCRLPPSIIKKLGLSFPKTRTTKMYGSVPLDYGREVLPGQSEPCDEGVVTASGHDIVQANHEQEANCDTSAATHPNSKHSQHTSGKKKALKDNYKDAEMKRRMTLNIEENMISKEASSEEDADSCEEWERHEALYDDPANQERNKQRLFEEEIELKWEKGGSGLVFYTDAQYWHAQEGDFDEQTADDWDVDMSGYYEAGAGDKDARDYLTMRQERRRRHGIEHTDSFTAGISSKKKKKEKKAPDSDEDEPVIGQFEAHTRGFGRRMLEGQGWAEGQGLGGSISGRAHALDNDGQHPRNKHGLGYRGEKLGRHAVPGHRTVVISTVYDDPAITDPVEPLTRRHEPYHLTYRDQVPFLKSNDTLLPPANTQTHTNNQ